MRLWSKLCFISKADFIAYSGSTRNNNLFESPYAGRTEDCTTKELTSDPEAHSTSALQSKLSAPPIVDGKGHKYNSRNSTREKTYEQQAKEQQKSKEPKDSKDSKDAKAFDALLQKMRVLEEEKKALKLANNTLKSEKK